VLEDGTLLSCEAGTIRKRSPMCILAGRQSRQDTTGNEDDDGEHALFSSPLTEALFAH